MNVSAPLRAIRDFLLPPLCHLCDGALPHQERVCPPCQERWTWLPEGCPTCGALSTEPSPCEVCATSPPPWDRLRSLVAFGEGVSQLLHRVKYGDQPALAAQLGAWMAEDLAALSWPHRPTLVPVPLHRDRLAQRGYNQAALMAEAIHDALGWPLAPALSRRPARGSQARQRGALRAENVEGAFVAADDAPDLSGCTAILIDDVFTTGATARTCVAALRSLGASSCWVVTFARAL